MKIKFYFTIIFMLARMLQIKYGIFDWFTEVLVWEHFLHLLNAKDDFAKVHAEEYKEFMKKVYEKMEEGKRAHFEERQNPISAPPWSEGPDRGSYNYKTPEQPRWWLPDSWTFAKCVWLGYTLNALYQLYRMYHNRYP